jgi:hypothetical protein
MLFNCKRTLYFIWNAYCNEIEIPQAEFEVTPQAFSEMPNTETRTEYLLMKNKNNY